MHYFINAACGRRGCVTQILFREGLVAPDAGVVSRQPTAVASSGMESWAGSGLIQAHTLPGVAHQWLGDVGLWRLGPFCPTWDISAGHCSPLPMGLAEAVIGAATQPHFSCPPLPSSLPFWGDWPQGHALANLLHAHLRVCFKGILTHESAHSSSTRQALCRWGHWGWRGVVRES